MVFISKEKIAAQVKEAEKKGSSRVRTENRSLTTENRILQEKLANSQAESKALKETRTDMRNIRKNELELEIMSDDIDAKEKRLDAKEKRYEKLLTEIETEGKSKYENGYADGVADGLRKVTELTKDDRDNMTKIAMVSAARGSDAAQVKGVTDVLRLTESNTDSKTQ